MSKITIPCDNCKRKFVVKQPKKKIHNDGIEGRLIIYYISCPHCKEKFVSFVENEKIKGLIKENKLLHKKLVTIHDDDDDDDELIEAQEEFEKRVKRIDSIRKDLILRFSKYVS